MSFGRTKCDLSVVSDLKTARIPCCGRQRRRGSDTPLIYGKTAVDLNSVSGSTLGAAFLVLVSFFTKEEITVIHMVTRNQSTSSPVED